MTSAQCGQDRGNVQRREGYRRCDAQDATNVGGPGSDGVVGGIELLQQAMGVLVVGAARLGLGDAAGGPVQQRHTKAFFERIDQARDRRCGQAQLTRGSRKASAGDDDTEGLQFGESIHEREVV